MQLTGSSVGNLDFMPGLNLVHLFLLLMESNTIVGQEDTQKLFLPFPITMFVIWK